MFIEDISRNKMTSINPSWNTDQGVSHLSERKSEIEKLETWNESE